MKRLGRAIQRKRLGGQPMPRLFHSLPAIRRSEVTMFAAQPGAGKSLLALWHAIKWVEFHNMRGIYFSADSAELGQGSRALAMAMANLSASEAEDLLTRGDPWAVEKMTRFDGLCWSFEDDLSYDNINDEVEAFAEMWGTYPDFIIVDNLTDVEGQAEDEWATQRRALKALVQLARATNSATIALHHTSEDERVKEDPCPPRSAIQGKCSQKPALIWTLADRGSQRPVATVKDRFSKSDKSGRSASWLRLDESTLHFSEI